MIVLNGLFSAFPKDVLVLYLHSCFLKLQEVLIAPPASGSPAILPLEPVKLFRKTLLKRIYLKVSKMNHGSAPSCRGLGL